jgi:hypothetical protein
MLHEKLSPDGKKNINMDMNKTMQELQERFARIQIDLRKLLDDYDGTVREINKQYMTERQALGSMEGLDGFYRLLQVMRRNRDVIGSLDRGSQGLRPVDKFKFVEEDIPEPKVEKKKPRIMKAPKEPESVNLHDFVGMDSSEADLVKETV